MQLHVMLGDVLGRGHAPVHVLDARGVLFVCGGPVRVGVEVRVGVRARALTLSSPHPN